MGSMIDVAPSTAATRGDGARNRINARILYQAEINYQSVITNSQAAAIMPSHRNGKKQIMVSGKVDRVNYVGDIHATRNQERFLIDHCVINFARLIVLGVVRFDDAPSQIGF